MSAPESIALAVAVISAAVAAWCCMLAVRAHPPKVVAALREAQAELDEARAERATWTKHIQGLLEEVQAEGERAERARRSAAASRSKVEAAREPNGAADPLRALEVQAFLAQTGGRS